MKRILLSFALCLACNPNLALPGRDLYPTACPEAGPFIETLTYNVGLAPGVVPLATPRIAIVADEIAKFREVGVMCLQEVWTQEARDAIVTALALPADNVYYVDTRGQGDDLSRVNVCRAEQIGPLVACAQAACKDWPEEEQSRCALAACNQEIVGVYLNRGENCLNCLVSSVGKSIDETVKTCTTPGHGVSHSYDGQNGVMLVSRWPLKGREAILLPSSIANREALFATIEIDKRQPLEVACTHVSTWNQLPPSEVGPDGRKLFKDWDAEMIAQVSIVSKKLNERAKGRPQLFLVDLNAGPAIGDAVVSAAPKVWKRIRSLGFSSPAADAEEPFCSTCDGNSLRSPGAKNYLLDHVLVRDPVGGSRLMPKCVRRVLDDGHRRYFPGYDGRLVDHHVSDHYGVAVTFSYE